MDDLAVASSVDKSVESLAPWSASEKVEMMVVLKAALKDLNWAL